MTEATVWALADDRAGNVAQAIGVAEALGAPYRVIDVAYDKKGKWPNLIRGASLLGIDPATISSLSPPWPSLVIGAGRRTAPLARWLKKNHGAKLVQIMDPGWPGRNDFDLIAIPRHDDAPPRGNVIFTIGSCHRVTESRLQEERALWLSRFAQRPRPYLAVIIGGATKSSPFDVSHAEELMKGALRLASVLGATILATTSRRTGAEAEAMIEKMLPWPHFLHRWSKGGDNPYPALLSLADAVIVTGDSMSMCSEACFFPGPVYIYAPNASAKHRKLHQLLYKDGYAHPLGAEGGNWSHPPLNASFDVAKEIRARGLL